MIKNVYAPLSGGLMQEKIIDIIANNLANTNTTAFKEDEIAFKAEEANPWPNYAHPHPPAPFKQDMSEVYPLKGNEMSYVALAEVKTSFSQGSLQRTGNDTDFALQGKGFFSVNTPFGQRLTRDGGFVISPDGVLVTKNGHPVEGENGLIQGLQGGKLKVLPTGEVYVGKQFIDKLKVVSVDDEKNLERIGENLWIHNGPPENMKKFSGEISQGFLEASNVNPMRNLTNMIIAQRNYESLQKAIKTQDESMQRGNKISEV